LPAEAIFSLIYLGLLGTSLAHWFWQEGVARLGAAKAGIYLYLEPLATTALAVPYLHESFGIYTAVGGFMVLLGVWNSQRKMIRKPL
jgi:drug/metabolite transporter (DMT)-like permease